MLNSIEVRWYYILGIECLGLVIKPIVGHLVHLHVDFDQDHWAFSLHWHWIDNSVHSCVIFCGRWVSQVVRRRRRIRPLAKGRQKLTLMMRYNFFSSQELPCVFCQQLMFPSRLNRFCFPQVFLKRAHELKDEGNRRFQAKDYMGALDNYDQALKLTPEGHPDRAVFHRFDFLFTNV